ncbi:O-antigen ligase family protein [Pontibacter ummariensis]|uniref:O-antigen ligase family protein n=1 Tax=Pontibacter ummariensis TaxID=1610492 RepID=UPI0015C68F5E|nr:O-antigen ligase family protein [Pontibacter ummariensis]
MKTTSNKESLYVICIKLIIVLLLGNFCLAQFPFAVNLCSFVGIVIIFFSSLKRLDFPSFLIQLFFCNHFVFGNEKGGVFNLAALLALIMYSVYDQRFIMLKSSFSKANLSFLFLLVVCQLLSLVANQSASFDAKVSAFFIFLSLVVLILFLSKIKIENSDYVRFIEVQFFFSIYLLVVSLNQKFEFIPFNSQLIPKFTDVEFEFNVFRSSGTFLNFEAYAEYSLSMIALLLPGVFSGSFKKVSLKFYLVCVTIIVISISGIFLSVTRSSFLLLPLVLVFILYKVRKRVKVKAVVPFITAVIFFFVVNSYVQIFDISAFAERSSKMNLSSLSITDIASGSEMNRGSIFAYAFKRIEQNGGYIGEGYFTTVDDYKSVHFHRAIGPFADYHNLYLSSIVIWGYLGAFFLVSLFVLPLYKGFVSFSKTSKNKSYDVDLLLGFNVLFVFFLINQYKIQFVRESNYLMVVMIFLVLYCSIIKNIESNSGSLGHV